MSSANHTLSRWTRNPVRWLHIHCLSEMNSRTCYCMKFAYSMEAKLRWRSLATALETRSLRLTALRASKEYGNSLSSMAPSFGCNGSETVTWIDWVAKGIIHAFQETVRLAYAPAPPQAQPCARRRTPCLYVDPCAHIILATTL